MAAARSRHDVARMLRADSPPAPIDGSFVAVLAAQARLAPATPAATPRRTLMLAGAAAAVVASTVGVAVAANQGLWVSPDPQRTPPATAPSDTSTPRPAHDDDPDELQDDERLGRPDGSEESAPHEDRADAPAPPEDTSTAGTPTDERPSNPGGEATQGDPTGDDRPRGDDDAGDDERDGDPGETESPDPEKPESPDPEESEAPEPDQPDEPESEPESESDAPGAEDPHQDGVAG